MIGTSAKAGLLVAAMMEGFKEAREKFIDMGYPEEVVDNLLADFRRLRDQRRLGPGENDIDRYDSMEQVQRALAQAGKKITARVKREKLNAERRAVGVQIKKDAKAHVAVPQSWEDAKLMSLGTRWCVGMAKTHVHWDNYARSTHYMATIKGKPSPWVENHPELGPDERPNTKHLAWKIGLNDEVEEVGDGETAGGPGRYAIVPDILYKVVYTTPPTHEARNSADKLIPVRTFLELTGMTFNDFNEHAWSVAKEAGITALEFMRQASPEAWTWMGRHVPMRAQWINETVPDLSTTEQAAAWMNYWMKDLPNDTFDPKDPGDQDILSALETQFEMTRPPGRR